MITNSFRGDCEFILNKIKNKDHFSFSKYADGEFAILVNNQITNIDNWHFNPQTDSISRNLLIESFLYDSKSYFVGVSCNCCQPKPFVDWMRNNVGSKNITWANLFVNSNYDFFVDNYLEEFKNWKVNLVSSEKSKIENLPFEIISHIPIGRQAWKDELHLIPDLESLSKNVENQMFLFCAGPFGNILSHKLHQSNPNNIYLDIGSTLNQFLLDNPNRDYYDKDSIYRKQTCIW